MRSANSICRRGIVRPTTLSAFCSLARLPAVASRRALVRLASSEQPPSSAGAVDPLDALHAVNEAVQLCERGRADHLRVGELLDPSAFHFDKDDIGGNRDTAAVLKSIMRECLKETYAREDTVEEVQRLYRRCKRVGNQGGGFDELDEAWAALRLSARFAHQGTLQDSVPLLDTLELWVKGADGKQHVFPLNKELDVEALLAHCSPSPYGDLRSKTTRLDPSVRLAMELPSAETASSEGGKPSFRMIHLPPDLKPRGLMPSLAASHASIGLFGGARKLYAVPQKLNIYGPGGHFKLHVDTPVGDRAAMLGTVLVALPSKFTGGTLVVHPPGLQASGAPDKRHAPVEWAPHKLFDEYARPALPAIAFYGDCPHEVQEVTSGHRVTVSFAIYEDRSMPSSSTACEASRQANATQQAESCARLVSWVRRIANPSPGAGKEGRPAVKPQPLGLILSHGYTITALEDDSKAASNLKGSDALLYRALVEAASVEGEAGLGGASVQVLPVLVAEQEWYEKYDHYHWTPITNVRVKKGVYRLTQQDLEQLVRYGPRYNPLPLVATGGDRSFPLPLDIPFVTCREGADVVELKKFQEMGGHTGNQTDPFVFDDIYFAGALVVIPPSYDGKRPAGEDEEDDDDDDDDDDEDDEWHR